MTPHHRRLTASLALGASKLAPKVTMLSATKNQWSVKLKAESACVSFGFHFFDRLCWWHLACHHLTDWCWFDPSSWVTLCPVSTLECETCFLSKWPSKLVVWGLLISKPALAIMWQLGVIVTLHDIIWHPRYPRFQSSGLSLASSSSSSSRMSRASPVAQLRGIPTTRSDTC